MTTASNDSLKPESDVAANALNARRRLFLDTYVASFLAAEASRQREFAEQTGTSHSYGRHQPVEDAFYLAECAWENIIELDLQDRA